MKVTDEQVQEALEAYWFEADEPVSWPGIRAALESLGGVWLSEGDAREVRAHLCATGREGVAYVYIDPQLTPATPEPAGKWAVVRDAEGVLYRRQEFGGWKSYAGVGGHVWKRLAQPVEILFEGVTE